ncbi:MAG: glycosyl hydrolase 115 family protein [Oscillospiraceae bacterium]|jgi:hypothetical protein|nr:glycosyl hydrolase 115 family protein [Oscillospiraceae bacterium]
MKAKRFMKALSFLPALALMASAGLPPAAPAPAARVSASGAALPPVPDKGSAPGEDEFVLLYDRAATLYIDAGDWEGAAIALTALQGDIELVGGQRPAIVNDVSRLSGMAVLAGTIGKSAVIDKLIADGKIDARNISGKWESYLVEVVDEPAPGVTRALVIAGSDKRGTIYGIYKISEMIGVSPWVWWADSVPVRRGKLTFPGDLRIEQGEPSVKYRGIFLNDEAPSLSGWVSANFGRVLNGNATGGYTHEFYQKVFELLLRLKGNYLWPAMWNNSFHTDDLLNSAMADTYGIVMGTSHQEHMTCADKEWSWSGLGAWNYATNRDNIYNFWKNGVTERGKYEAVLTLGMRGLGDTPILGSGATLKDNMELLARVMKDQREIIKDVYGAEDAPPQLLALYKEVENFYYGSDEYGVLNVPDDVTIMLCDDNHGYVRTLPTPQMRERSGGFGMYYHFDYRGSPISYQWINQTPLTKVWEQMTTAYDAGVDRVWIVNVGDLKPMELPIDYFLNLAYDYARWSPTNKVDEFTRAFAAREFGGEFAADGAAVLDGYTKILGARKAEVVMPDPSTFSLTSFDEADRTLAAFESVVKTAEAVYARLPEHKKDTFYQLALYPARAAMNVYKCNIYAAWSVWMADRALPAANEYALLARAAFDADAADTEYYNKELSGGKWDGIMRQNHIGYTAWDGPSTGIAPNIMPKTGAVTPLPGSELAVRAQYGGEPARSGAVSLPAFTNLSGELRYIDILNGKSFPFEYTVSANADWVILGATQGVCVNQTRVGVSVDRSKVTQNASAVITVSGAGGTVTVNVTANVFAQSLADNTYVETHGYVSVNPARYTGNSPSGTERWSVIDGYGRDGSAVKVLPNGKSFAPGAADAPYIEYTFYIQTPGAYNVNTFIAPSGNRAHKTVTPLLQQLRFSTQIDAGQRQTASGLLSANYAPDSRETTWAYGKMNNTRMVTTPHGQLSAGLHTLRVYAVDPDVAIQKIVIAPVAAVITNISGAPQTYHFMDSYFGPPESYYAGDTAPAAPYPGLDAGIAQYTASDVAVTFANHNGGVIQTVTALGSNTSRLTAAQIASVAAPPREGYAFSGWLMPNGAPLTDGIIFTSPTTVTARYISTSAVTHTYMPNGGAGVSYESGAPAQTAIVIEENKFTNAGKVFVTWSTKPDGGGDTYSPGVTVIAGESMELYAVWADRLPATRSSSGKAGSGVGGALDGNADTSLKMLGLAGEWVEIGFTGSYTIDTLYVSEDGGNITGYEAQYWDMENNRWETAVTGNGIGPDADLLFFQARAVTTDKVRLLIVSATAPAVIKEITLRPFVNHGLAANGGAVTALPPDGEGSASDLTDGDRLDYTKRWRINSQAGITDPVTLTLPSQKSISVVNIFSITGLWNSRPRDIRRDTKGTTALGTIRNLNFEYTADGAVWLPLPGGVITDNEYSWISVELASPIAMSGVRFTVPDQSNSDYSDSWIRVVEFEALELVSTFGMIDLTGVAAPDTTAPAPTPPSVPPTGDNFTPFAFAAFAVSAAGLGLLLRRRAGRG